MRHILGPSARMAAVTMASRVLGLVREQVRAALLGTSDAADAFTTAYIIPNLLRRLVGEGALTAAFVPVYTHYSERIDARRLRELTGRFVTFFSMVLALTAALGTAGAHLLVADLFAPGYSSTPSKLALTVFLTRMMFPYVFFIGLAALCQAILNSNRYFTLPASTPIVLNLSIIGSALLLSSRLPTPAHALALGVVAGGILQAAMQLPLLWRLGFRPRLPRMRLDPFTRRILRLMLPGVFGAGIYQINVAVSQAMASYLGKGAVSSLQYSSRLLELVLGVFVVAVSTAILPELSRRAATGDLAGMRRTFSFCIVTVCMITMPASITAILMRKELVHLLFSFKSGSFGARSVDLTAWALLFHMTGLVFIGLCRVLVPVFYSFHDTTTPVVVAAAAMLINIAGCLYLPAWFSHGGIALANTLSALVQCCILMPLAWRLLKQERPELSATAAKIARIAAACMVMGAALRWVLSWLPFPGSAGKATQLYTACAHLLAAAGVYGTMLHLLKVEEFSALASLVIPSGARSDDPGS